jgi:Ty3 transposon capsid-like protein/Zinc knuckle
MTPDDIRNLIAGIQRPPQTNHSKDLKFAEQASFTGKPEDLENLLREAEIRFSVQDAIYDNPTKKAYYVLSLFKSGDAKLWKEQYVQQRQDRTLCEGNDYAQFVRTLKENFKDVGSADDALLKLQSVEQGKRTVDQYNTQFRILIQKGGLDQQDNAKILCQMYAKGLKQNIVQQIIMNGPPETLSEWMIKASTIDSYARRANNFFATAVKAPQKKQWKPRPYISRDQGEPMEIDRLAPREETRRKENQLCFKCGKPGHFSKECPNPRNEGQGSTSYAPRPSNNHFQGNKRQFQGNKRGGKQKAQIRAITTGTDEERAEQTRIAIRQIINQNYNDQSSDGYQQFIQSVQEKGFS